MTNTPKTIKVSPETFKAWQRAAARAASAKRDADTLKAKLNLPQAAKTTLGEYVLTDGNGAQLGKYTVSHRDGFAMPARYMGRLS